MGGNNDNSKVLRPKNLSVEELLRALNTNVKNLDKNVLTNIENILKSTIRTAGRVVYSSGEAGTISPGFRSFTVTNLGSTNALLDGQPLFPGQSNSFDAGGQSDVLTGMSYDAQATTIEIITVL